MVSRQPGRNRQVDVALPRVCPMEEKGGGGGQERLQVFVFGRCGQQLRQRSNGTEPASLPTHPLPYFAVAHLVDAQGTKMLPARICLCACCFQSHWVLPAAKPVSAGGMQGDLFTGGRGPGLSRLMCMVRGSRLRDSRTQAFCYVDQLFVRAQFQH